MNIHFLLDFTTPFGVGDEVYTQWPPQASPVDSPAGPGCQKATITSVKVLLDLPLGHGLVVSQPIQTQPLTIERVIYSLVPVPPSILSAFTVECPTGQDSNPVLFASEQELLAHYPDLVPC